MFHRGNLHFISQNLNFDAVLQLSIEKFLNGTVCCLEPALLHEASLLTFHKNISMFKTILYCQPPACLCYPASSIVAVAASV